jgi:hypothetical protein
LRLYTRYRTEQADCTVKDAQGTLDLHRKVHVTWGVNDVDSVLLVLEIPKTSRRSRSNRDAALLFLLHPIHGGSAVVNLSYFVGDAGVEQNAFGGSSFTGIDVGANSDITIAVNRGFASHVDTSSL